MRVESKRCDAMRTWDSIRQNISQLRADCRLQPATCNSQVATCSTAATSQKNSPPEQLSPEERQSEERSAEDWKERRYVWVERVFLGVTAGVRFRICFNGWGLLITLEFIY